jgi:hypothetical protein
MTTADSAPGSGRTRVERFLAHLDGLTGGTEPRFLPVASTTVGLPGLTVMGYLGLPEPGMFTAVTYGVSLVSHEEWRLGKPELTITVASDDEAWGLAVGVLAEQLRGSCPFCYGDTINFGERITPESQMTAFVVFAPASLAHEDYSGIDVGDSLPINIAGCYPIHDSERQYIRENGLKAFWNLQWDPYDVRRSPAV